MSPKKMQVGQYVHVIPVAEGWAVSKAGALRPRRVFDSRHGAVQFAQDLVKKSNSEVMVIHEGTGRVQERRRLGADGRFQKIYYRPDAPDVASVTRRKKHARSRALPR